MISSHPTRAQRVQNTMHPLLENVFSALEQAGIPWCLLRGEAELADPAGDVDLLIGHADAPRVRRILERLGFLHVPAWGQGSHTFFFTYYQPTDRWIKLDIVTELSYGPQFALRTRAEAGCLARRQRNAVLAVLAPDDAFWTLLLHCMLDKETFAPHHAQRLQELVAMARIDGPMAQMVEKVCSAPWDADRVVACVRRGDWLALEQTAPMLRAAWMQQQPRGTWWQPRVRRFRQLTHRLLYRLRRRGLSVALLGPDGAGKSTLAASIQDSFCFPVRSVYMGLWQQTTTHTRVLGIPGSHLARRMLTIWSFYLLARGHQALGRLVIFDRYTYDARLSRRKHLHWRERLYWWVVGHACPTPDLVLVLDAPGSVMYERKGEHSAEFLETQRQHFLALRQQIPQLEVVDATRAQNIVRSDVVERIWRQYLAHWIKQ